MKQSVLELEIGIVKPHPISLKSYQTKNIDGLRFTMKLAGQLESAKVVKRGNQYLIFDGISRYLVAKELQWEHFLVEVFDYTDAEIGDQFVLRNLKQKGLFLKSVIRLKLS